MTSTLLITLSLSLLKQTKKENAQRPLRLMSNSSEIKMDTQQVRFPMMLPLKRSMSAGTQNGRLMPNLSTLKRNTLPKTGKMKITSSPLSSSVRVFPKILNSIGLQKENSDS